MHIFPWKPKPSAVRADISSPSSSARSTQTVPRGASMTGSARGGGYPRAGKGQLSFSAAPRHVHVEGKIAGTKGGMPNACTSGQDYVEVGQTTRRLDDRDQTDGPRCQVLLAFQLREQPIDRGERGGTFDLWQDDPV